MIKLEEMRHVLNMNAEEETDFFDTKEKIETLLEAIDASKDDPNFYTVRESILDEIRHIVQSTDPLIVPFLLILEQQGGDTEFRSEGDSEE